MNKIITRHLFLAIFTTTIASATQKETWYQQVWCEGKGGIVEKKLDDGRRVDCITKTHAIEMDFAKKWLEAIGQSLDYAMLTGKKAGIVLIVKKPWEMHHWERLQQVVEHYQLPITLWKLGP